MSTNIVRIESREFLHCNIKTIYITGEEEKVNFKDYFPNAQIIYLNP